ncbi:MAG: AbrB/MazE/SpoVT family DNA-binding domain-containing protein [Candidatus Methanomethylicaceae archaeon]
MSNPILVKVTRKGQITLPKEYRDALNIEEGDIIYAHLEENKIVLMKPGIPEPGEPIGEEEYKKLISRLEEERKKWL